MATNPLGIFQAALANGPHTEPVDVGQVLNRNALAQAQTSELQQNAQQIALENKRKEIELKADQAMRDAIKANTKSIPVGPPPAGFPPPPADASGQPVNDPNYHQAQAAAAVNAPKTDFYGVAAQLAAQGYGDRALTLLKTHADLNQKELDNAQKALQTQQERNAAIGQRIGGLLSTAKPQGAQGPADPAGVAQADQQWPALRRELIEQYGENPANLPEHFDPTWADPYFASKVGVDKANAAVMAHLEQQNKAAETNRAVAETGQLTAQTGLQEEQTKRMALQRKLMEKASENPGSMESAIDQLISPTKYPDVNKRTKAEFTAAMAIGGPEAAQSVLSHAVDKVDQMELQTDPKRMQFDIAKARATARATAEGQADVFGTGESGALSQTAQDIANYRVPFSQAVSRLPAAARESIMQQVRQINPNFQAAQYDVAKKTEEDATSGKIAKSANALNTMMGHLDVLDRAAEALKNGNIQLLNRIANGIGVQAGKSAKTVYDTIVHRVGPEVTTAYLSAGGTEGERGTNEEDFSSKQSPEQIHANIAVSAQLAESKIKALQDQYNRGTYGRGSQKLISDEAETTRQRLAGNSPVANLPRVNTKEEYDKLPKGAQYIDAQDGKPYTKR